MNSYTASGFQCQLGDLIFSDFVYHYGSPLGADGGPVADANYRSGFGSVGSGANVLDSDVDVSVAVGGMGLTFGGNWVVDRYQTVDLYLSYKVTPITQAINSAFNSYNLSITGTPCASYTNPDPPNNTITPCPSAQGNPSAKVTSPILGTFTNGTYNFVTPTSGPITIINTVHMDANNVCCGVTNTRTRDSQVVHLSAFTDQFTETAAVPEPATFGFLGAGALAMLYWKRRQRV